MVLSTQQIHALIIGINDYSRVPRLHGAVSDALRFEEYLLNSRHVPSTNIIRLFNAHATRINILAALRSFRTNTCVEKDSAAIIVFFAGHGASAAVPSHWPAWLASGGKAELLCPVDIGETNADGHIIEGIPDYTIRVLLDELSQAKGNNITLILDCCHSGGMNRAAAQGWAARSIDNPPPLSGAFDLDIDFSQNRGAHVAELGFSGTGRDSHILLAACSRNQFAYENQGHGLFTTAVLEALSQPGSDQLTYASLIHRLVIPYCPVAPQTPHCEGTHRRRRLFDSWSPEGDADVVLCHREGTVTSFTLEAGAMHGVAVGNQYAIFDTDILEESSGHLTATVQRVDAFTSVLVPSGASHGQLDPLPHSDDSVKELRYARLTKETSVLLRVYCSDMDYVQSLLANVGSFVAVVEATEADLILTLQNEEVIFERGPKAAIVAPDIGFPTRLAGTIPIKALEETRYAIRSYARFLHHLRRKSSSDRESLLGFSLKRLRTTGGTVEPDGEELLDGENSDLVTVTVDDSFYGLELNNRTDLRLFVHILWFDPSTSEIVLWYDPCQGNGQTNAPGVRLLDTELEPHKVLSAGFGNGGVHPFYFELNDRLIDVSLLKVFVSTTPTHMRWLEQPSPFEGHRKVCLESWEGEDDEEDLWMTKTITVVQKMSVA